MKRVFFKSLAVIIGLFFYAFTNAQQQYTPYDDLPGMIKSYKPAYQNSYPRWGKMLYQYPVNYNAVIKAFNNSRQKDDKVLVRYYKLWSKLNCT